MAIYSAPSHQHQLANLSSSSKMAIILDHKLSHHTDSPPTDRLSLTAEERSRTRFPFVTDQGVEVYLQLDRGTTLRHGDLLQSIATNLVVEILAKPEPVLAATTNHPVSLMQAAYHLGNRHVAIEITSTHLYILPDPVLADLLHQRGLSVTELVRPFQPEAGAYEHHHH
jgi:urease accessory protein